MLFRLFSGLFLLYYNSCEDLVYFWSPPSRSPPHARRAASAGSSRLAVPGRAPRGSGMPAWHSRTPQALALGFSGLFAVWCAVTS
eukprot:3876978-Prymnesium_polylepis.1